MNCSDICTPSQNESSLDYLTTYASAFGSFGGSLGYGLTKAYTTYKHVGLAHNAAKLAVIEGTFQGWGIGAVAGGLGTAAIVGGLELCAKGIGCGMQCFQKFRSDNARGVRDSDPENPGGLRRVNPPNIELSQGNVSRTISRPQRVYRPNTMQYANTR